MNARRPTTRYDGDWPSGTDGMARLVRTHDWSATPVGPIGQWPRSLRTLVDMLLANKFPAILGWGPELICIYNDAYRPLLGEKPEALGHPLLEVWSEARDIIAPQIDSALRNQPVVFEDAPFTLMRHGHPEQAYFDYTFSPVHDDSGTIAGVLNLTVETTARHEAQENARRSEEALKKSTERLDRERRFLHAVIDNAPIGISIAEGRDGERAILNQTARRMTGMVDLTGGLSDRYRHFTAVHPDGRPYEIEDYPTVRVLKTGEEIPGEEMIYEKDGGRRRWLVKSTPLLDERGDVVSAITTFWDVEDLRASEETREVLIRELDHRVKNTLAVVQSIAIQTFRGVSGAEEVVESFQNRLQALSRAHNLLALENWKTADLAKVVANVLETPPCLARVTGEGPSVVLQPKQAVAFAMGLHELCTNAIKYGALSGETGSVSVTWGVSDGERPELDFIWRESGGPTVSPPAHRGFGSRVIEQVMAQDLGGSVALSFEPSGVVCTIRMPLDT